MCPHVNVFLRGCQCACDCAEATRNGVMPHQRACIRREEKQALWLVCGSSKPASNTLDRVGKKKKKQNYIVFVSVIHEPKPQPVLASRPLCKAVQVV